MLDLRIVDKRRILSSGQYLELDDVPNRYYLLRSVTGVPGYQVVLLYIIFIIDTSNRGWIE